MNKIKPNGVITTYVMVFGSIFLLLLGGLYGFILLQLKTANRQVAWHEALQIAEAGIDYYKWCKNNDVESSCQTQKDYLDAQGQTIGTFSLAVDSSMNCDIEGSTTITSTGWTKNYPDLERQIQISYAQTSVAKYAFLVNDNVWAGADRIIRGEYHSNGGIRMDGNNQSLVTSALPEWVCTSSFGCSTCPTNSTPPCWREGPDCKCPGVFSTSGNSQTDLFISPVTSFDFEGITIDLAQIKSITLSSPQEYYWPPSTDIDPEAEGYHIKFKNDGTFEVWIITELDPVYAYSTEEGWHYDYFSIENEYLYGDPININPSCSLIYIEDNMWIQGELNKKVTIASADLINTDIDTNVILVGNIDYTALDGSVGLTVIGQNNVLISPDSPDEMKLKGIFIAQKGHYGINHYPNRIKSSLETYGAIITNGRTGTRWTSGGQTVSGYLQRENYFDSNLVHNAPPFTPYAIPEFSVINWEEVE